MIKLWQDYLQMQHNFNVHTCRKPLMVIGFRQARYNRLAINSAKSGSMIHHLRSSQFQDSISPIVRADDTHARSPGQSENTVQRGLVPRSSIGCLIGHTPMTTWVLSTFQSSLGPLIWHAALSLPLLHDLRPSPASAVARPTVSA